MRIIILFALIFTVYGCDPLQSFTTETDRLHITATRCNSPETLIQFTLRPLVNETLYYSNNVNFDLSMILIDYAHQTVQNLILPNVSAFHMEEGFATFNFSDLGTLRVNYSTIAINSSRSKEWEVVHDEGLQLDLSWNLLATAVLKCHESLHFTDLVYFIESLQPNWIGDTPPSVWLNGNQRYYMSLIQGQRAIQIQLVMECVWKWDCSDHYFICNKTNPSPPSPPPRPPPPPPGPHSSGKTHFWGIVAIILFMVCVIVFFMYFGKTREDHKYHMLNLKK